MQRAMDQTTTASTTTSATSLGGTRGLLAELEFLHARGEDALLGIVVATEGSTYQKPGALVLLDRGGLRHGVISGGCLEPELERRAQATFADGRAALVEFDTRTDEDLVFGSGTGCRGRVHLLLLPQPPGAPLTQALREAAREGAVLHLVLTLNGDQSGAGSAQQAPNFATAHDQWLWNARGSASGAPVGAADLMLRIAPPPRIVLLGAGPETPLLLEFMRRFGWFVDVVEHRQRWITFVRGASVDNFRELPPAAAAAQLQQQGFDAAIVMSHNFTIDAQHLRFCARSAIPYVGLLGPPARRDALLAELGGDAGALHARLHAPVGLDLGGSGPEAIALAIIAELQQFFAARSDA
jgi:xanthine dehydrogenase accessory factor